MTNIRVKRFIVISEAIHIILPYLVSKLVTTHSNEQHLHGHSWFLNFDGLHYFYNQYSFQPNFAFFPYLVMAIQNFKIIFGESTTIGIFIILNRCLFIMSVFEIYQILRLLAKQKGEKFAQIGTIIFIFNPASIFYHVIYTQSLFCFVTCKAINNSLQGKNQWKSVLYLCLGVCLRSNGLFIAPVIGLQILYTFIAKLKDKRISLYLLTKGLAIIFVISLPFILHLLWSYLKICVWNKSQLQICQESIPNIYSYVQQKYWNVGLFKYFRVQNALFIMIGSPAIIVGALGLNLYQARWDLKEKGLYLSFVILFIVTVGFTNIQSSTRFFSTHPFFYYILAVLGRRWRCIRVWIVFYYFIGIFLYTSAFPWT